MNIRTLLTAASLCAAAQFIQLGVAQAETVAVDGKVSIAPSTIATPARGSTMSSVEKKFGAPANRHPTVGKPPITRWDYQGFSVFFEGNRVISSVVTSG